MIPDEPYTIRITNPNGDRIGLTLPWDADIEGWIEKLRVILTWATFDPETIREYLKEEE